jgi:hypothetical protein
MQKIMNFSSAIREIIEGKKVTKLEWNDQAIYIFLGEGLLKIKKADGVVASLLVSEADMVGTDWIVINEPKVVMEPPSISPTSLVIVKSNPQEQDEYDGGIVEIKDESNA